MVPNKFVVIGGLVMTASVLNQFIDVLYTLILDFRETGKGKMAPEFKEHLQALKPTLLEWKPAFPSLVAAVNSSLVGGDNKIISLVNLGQEIKDKFSQFRQNEEFTRQELDLLNAAGLYLRRNSESAFKKLEKMAGTVSSWAARHLVPEVKSQSGIEPQIRKLVKKLTGRDDVFLSMDEAKAAKLTDAATYTKYLELARTFNKSWNDAFVAYVRSQDKKLVPYSEVLEYLDSMGYKYRLVTGFEGLVDDQRRMYTAKGKLIDGVPAAITSPTVEMNPKPNAENPWIFKAIKANGAAPTYFYTTDFKSDQAKHKFQLVRSVTSKIPVARKKWLASVKDFDPKDKHSVASAVLETLFQTSGRIGSKNNPTFGIATIQVRHVHIQGNGDLLISYLGKDSVRNKHILHARDPNQKWIVPVIIQLTDGKQPREPVFTYGNKAINPSTVNHLFKSLVGNSDVTVHKIRHFRGTALWNKEMGPVLEALLPKVQKAAAKSVNTADKLAMVQFTKLAEKVGKLLNHVRRNGGGDKVTGATALMNYIDPASQIQFWRALGLRPPRQLEKLMKEE